MIKESTNLNLPEPNAWSWLQLVVISRETPIKETIEPRLPLEIISTGEHEQSLKIAHGRVQVTLKRPGTILTAQPLGRATILAELHASFCYLLLTICSNGQAALLHDHWFNITEKIVGYKEFLRENFPDQEMITLVGGLRINQEENDEAQLRHINTLLSGTTQVYRVLLNNSKQLKLYPAEAVNGQGMGPSGLIYVPAALSKNNHPFVFAVPPGSGEANRQLFDPWSWRE